jgi:cobalamin biosynthesis protein CobD/CbiB
MQPVTLAQLVVSAPQKQISKVNAETYRRDGIIVLSIILLLSLSLSLSIYIYIYISLGADTCLTVIMLKHSLIYLHHLL